MRYGLRAVVVVAALALACRWGVAQIGPRYVIELPGQGGGTAGMAQGKVQLAGQGLALIRFQGLSVLAVDADGEAYSREAAAGWPAADVLLVLPPAAGRYDGLAPLQALRSGAPVIVAEREDGGAAELVQPAARQPAQAGAAQLYPMQVWNTLELRKQNTRLRVTAMAGAPGTRGVAGFMLELGNSRSSYRVYVSCREDEVATLAQRLPGADLALLPAPGAPRLLALRRGAAEVGMPAALTAAGYAFTAIKR
ncbi:hypothetical protein SAMN05216319_3553 [Duganella sp. CF402]|uniref:hypothetical protein n=1 Tax=unclassified Duganella TaxID=2636909 RepID=UPI0008CB8BD3|nr:MULTISPECIES: hypothetical protein [unclassified Duganella]RZT08041.1 hypothetical protein EV582_0064 [Duganella sp. BK701]SEM07729.1 hypothetical protein SAMN05216319_3553 [Duganella sp. CF402]